MYQPIDPRLLAMDDDALVIWCHPGLELTMQRPCAESILSYPVWRPLCLGTYSPRAWAYYTYSTAA